MARDAASDAALFEQSAQPAARSGSLESARAVERSNPFQPLRSHPVQVDGPVVPIDGDDQRQSTAASAAATAMEKMTKITR